MLICEFCGSTSFTEYYDGDDGAGNIYIDIECNECGSWQQVETEDLKNLIQSIEGE